MTAPDEFEVQYLDLPYLCCWKDCGEQAILKKWFREAGRKEFLLCGAHAERASLLLHQAREYERQNPGGGR